MDTLFISLLSFFRYFTNTDQLGPAKEAFITEVEKMEVKRAARDAAEEAEPANKILHQNADRSSLGRDPTRE